MTVVSSSPTRVELEIGGERVVVDDWPEHFPQPPGPVNVDGERWNVTISAGAESPTPVPLPSAGRPSLAPAAVPSPSASPREGVEVLPPMPGRVIEVRVKDGDRVRKGDVLLVLEAMKMRNEVVSPADGIVRGVRVAAGANARAKEPMLFVAPEPAR